MTELKCPFCQQELGRKNINDIMCSNEKCITWKGNFYGSEDLWQALIDTKKKLDTAIYFFKAFIELYDKDSPDFTDALDVNATLSEIIGGCEEALEQINNKEQQ